MRYRGRYLISWSHAGYVGRETWVMERYGNLSSADIKKLEIDLGDKWGLNSPVVITNFVKIN
ncbi:hypothetical protein MH117_04960 [Paenibacillus sp. ACRRX]|uniref:hypothetical protein n=1 Tax=unclassified Paenibacillus TaxID=185978 RepID=UPI001EF705D2|nr:MULTISPECIES: hypothetical protein [unclassified Paenibacillus]MCG7406760.1 hypothetical protein [Paenibacillus sp. ACRRX]MDK8182093.1 hypothetical protein [Paenibacillus sp. UMB4589-SE434]